LNARVFSRRSATRRIALAAITAWSLGISACAPINRRPYYARRPYYEEPAPSLTGRDSLAGAYDLGTRDGRLAFANQSRWGIADQANPAPPDSMKAVYHLRSDQMWSRYVGGFQDAIAVRRENRSKTAVVGAIFIALGVVIVVAILALVVRIVKLIS
jgi:hypothetical protein